MALDKNDLLDGNAPTILGLLALFGQVPPGGAAQYPATADAAAQAWVDIYAFYAGKGTANGGVLTISALARSSMKAALLAGFTVPGTAPVAAQAIETGLVSFWTNVIAGPPATGPGALAPGPLKTALQNIFMILSTSASLKANAVATALDTATKTVVYALIIGGTTTVT